jgi:hypothetical protein
VKNCAHAVCFSSFFFTFFFFSFFCNGSWHHLMLMFQILWFNTQISRVYHHRIQCFLSNSELGFSNCQLKFVPNWIFFCSISFCLQAGSHCSFLLFFCHHILK